MGSIAARGRCFRYNPNYIRLANLMFVKFAFSSIAEAHASKIQGLGPVLAVSPQYYWFRAHVARVLEMIQHFTFNTFFKQFITLKK